MTTDKAEVEQLLRNLPDDSSIEDIQYHLYVLEKIREGIRSAEAEPTYSQEEAEAKLARWLTD